MTAKPPIAFRYTNGAMIPRLRSQADRFYEEGESYVLEEYHSRSINSHNHFFATLNDAWMNLPERLAGEYPTAEHLRKRLLIQAGYCDEQKVVFSTANDAIKASAIALAHDDYIVADVSDRTLTIWTAKSQSVKAMGAKDFQASKSAVLEIAAQMIGTDTKTLTHNAATASCAAAERLHGEFARSQ